MDQDQHPSVFWSIPAQQLLEQLNATPQGLTSNQVRQQLARCGANLGKLLTMVQVKVTVLRDGRSCDIPLDEVVPGDINLLNAGDVIPGDCLILEAKDLFIDEATLTGETYPVEKSAGVLPAETGLNQRGNSLWMGTHVVSGTATALVVQTGNETEFGKISDRLKLRPQETEFELGVKHFGYFLLEVTLILGIVIFVINVYFRQPVLEAFMFSLALAVGLTPLPLRWQSDQPIECDDRRVGRRQ